MNHAGLSMLGLTDEKEVIGTFKLDQASLTVSSDEPEKIAIFGPKV